MKRCSSRRTTLNCLTPKWRKGMVADGGRVSCPTAPTLAERSETKPWAEVGGLNFEPGTLNFSCPPPIRTEKSAKVGENNPICLPSSARSPVSSAHFRTNYVPSGAFKMAEMAQKWKKRGDTEGKSEQNDPKTTAPAFPLPSSPAFLLKISRAFPPGFPSIPARV